MLSGRAILLLFAAVVWSPMSALADGGAACGAPSSTAEIVTQLDAAETAWKDVEAEAFESVMDGLFFSIRCAGEPVDPDTASRYHLLQGLRAYAARDDEAAARAFAAARSIPGHETLPPGFVPEGHELFQLYLRLNADETDAVPVPEDGRLLFDGTPSDHRPTGRPVLVQLLDGTGKVVTTAWLNPTDPLPAYVARTGPSKRAKTLRLAGAGSGVAALALYGTAMALEADFWGEHPDWDQTDLKSRQGLTNGLTITAGALGVGSGVCLGLGFGLE